MQNKRIFESIDVDAMNDNKTYLLPNPKNEVWLKKFKEGLGIDAKSNAFLITKTILRHILEDKTVENSHATLAEIYRTIKKQALRDINIHNYPYTKKFFSQDTFPKDIRIASVSHKIDPSIANYLKEHRKKLFNKNGNASIYDASSLYKVIVSKIGIVANHLCFMSDSPEKIKLSVVKDNLEIIEKTLASALNSLEKEQNTITPNHVTDETLSKKRKISNSNSATHQEYPEQGFVVKATPNASTPQSAGIIEINRASRLLFLNTTSHISKDKVVIDLTNSNEDIRKSL